MEADHTVVGTTEVARMVGRNPSTISRWVASGRLRPIARTGGGANGGAMLFRRSDIEELAAQLNDRGAA